MKRVRWLLILLAIVLGAMVACTSGDSDDEGRTEEDVTDVTNEDLAGKVTLWYGWNEDESEALNQVIASFQSANPNVQFEALFKPFDDLRGAYETAVASGEGPSVLIGAADWGPALYDAALVADIGSDVDSGVVDSINPAAMGAVMYNGATVGLPQTVKGVVMFRNASLIDTAPATFDDVKALGEMVDIERGLFFSAGHLVAQGGTLMNDDGTPAFNTDEGAAWLGMTADFNDTEDYGETDVDLFKAGELGLIVDGTWNIGSLAEAIGADNLVIDMWPEGMNGFVQTENIYLSANTEAEDKTASMAFIEHFLSADAQTALVSAGHIPAITGVDVSDPHLSQAAAAFENGVVFPVIPQMGSYWDPMTAALNAVNEEGIDPAEALQAAFDDVTTALNQ